MELRFKIRSFEVTDGHRERSLETGRAERLNDVIRMRIEFVCKDRQRFK